MEVFEHDYRIQNDKEGREDDFKKEDTTFILRKYEDLEDPVPKQKQPLEFALSNSDHYPKNDFSFVNHYCKNS